MALLPIEEAALAKKFTPGITSINNPVSRMQIIKIEYLLRIIIKSYPTSKDFSKK